MDRSEAMGILLFGASIVLWQASCFWNRGRRCSCNTATKDTTANFDKSASVSPSRYRTRMVRYLSSFSKWSHYSDDEEMFIQGLPKVELHVHLDGSFDPDFLWDFLQRHPQRMDHLPISIVNPPWDPSTKELRIREKVQACRNSHDYHALCTCRGQSSLTEMLNCFQMFSPVVTGDLELLEVLAYDFCQRQYQQNIVYTEVRYSPHLLAYGATTTTKQQYDDPPNVSAQDVVHAITQGLCRGTADTGIVVQQILCAISWRPDWAQSVVELAEMFRDQSPCAVVGIDIAAGEEHFNPASPFHLPHVEMAQAAFAKNIPMTLHAGEVPHHHPSEAYTTTNDNDTNDDHVIQAVTEYHARRIGHGYRMADRPDTMQFIRDHQVHVEVCLTSSVETGGWVYEGNVRQWSTHPAQCMKDQGVSFSLSSDDPAVFHTSLAWQYRTALAKLKMTPATLIQTNLDAIEAAFCSESIKQHVKKLLVAYADERGIAGLEVERSEHGIHTPDPRQTLLKRTETPNFTDRVYLSNKEYS